VEQSGSTSLLLVHWGTFMRFNPHFAKKTN
jgi:hypothetical protein